MKLKLVQMTRIHCEKLQNIVGQGSVSPYHVTVSDDVVLGFFGQVCKSGESASSNDGTIHAQTGPEISWLQRALNTLCLRKN